MTDESTTANLDTGILATHRVNQRVDLIPPWDGFGVIPPIRPGAAGHELDRSPYQASMYDVARRFGESPARRKILRGLIEFRAKLRDIGIREGFQWLNGSFFECVEVTRGRDPKDIDVVTFTVLGDEAAQVRLVQVAPELFDHGTVWSIYHVDHYFVGLGDPLDNASVRITGYWYSMWSHRRDDYLWKGFVEVKLDADEDTETLAYLATLDAMGGDK